MYIKCFHVMLIRFSVNVFVMCSFMCLLPVNPSLDSLGYF